MKKCFMCKIEKSYNDFYPNQARYDGVQSYCKTCAKILSKKTRNKMSAEIKLRNNELNLKRNKILKQENPHKLWAYQTKGSLVKRAKKYSIPYDNFSHEEFVEMALLNDVCPILNIPLIYGGSKQTDNSATIDRFDPTLGYTRDNITVISQRANRIKNNATLEELIKIRDWLKSKLS